MVFKATSQRILPNQVIDNQYPGTPKNITSIFQKPVDISVRKKLIRNISVMSRNNLLMDVFYKITKGKKVIPVNEMRIYLKEKGFLNDDPHWKDVYDYFDTIENIDVTNVFEVFCNNLSDLSKSVYQSFIIGDFKHFTTALKEIFDKQYSNLDGVIYEKSKNAYKNSEKYGMSFCSIDGQRYNLGDYDENFCIHGCFKPINYGIAIEGMGLDKVSDFIGKEPSGQEQESVTMNIENKPYNPMVNSGAIMTCSLIEKDMNMADRFECIQNWWKRLAGGYKPGFDITTYLSEFQAGYSCKHLGYFMKSENLFPEGTSLEEVLQFYFQCCSIEMSCSKLAVVAATLANGGICPLTRERVFQNSTTKYILSLMYSCGMGDYSGQFSFKIGLPAKSGGKNGCIMVVIPSVGGFCTWSPRLEKGGKRSARGLKFFEDLVKKFTFHNFDILSKITDDDEVCDLDDDELERMKRKKTYEENDENKIDPLKKNKVSYSENVSSLLFAANENDMDEIRNLIMKGVDLNIKDYDKRTALHIAASEGHLEVVEILLKSGANPRPKDRFKNTPLIDAIRGNHTKIINILEQYEKDQNK